MRLTLDFETYYDHEYSLKRYSVEAYCRDSRFQVICCVALPEGGRPAAFDGWSLGGLAGLVEAADEVVCHNAYFDGYILESVLGIKAKRLACTSAMSRWTGLGRVAGQGLAALSQALGLGAKGGFLSESLGKRLEDFSPEGLRNFIDYCASDVDLTDRLYQVLRPRLPDEAMDFLALTLKMYTDPVLVLDMGKLAEYRARVLAKQESDQRELQRLFRFESKEEFLKALRSPGQFSRMLESLGREVPTKETPASIAKLGKAVEAGKELAEWRKSIDRPLKTAERSKIWSVLSVLKKGGRIPALSKDDQEFRDLLGDPDERVATLARLRAENNSSIALSRAETFLGVGRRASGAPVLPIPLAAWGAHTGRYAAGTGHHDAESDRTNLQNLPKRGGDTGLREAVEAPEGFVLVSGDSAQVEARVGAWLAGQDDLVELFRQGRDPYADMAAAIYGESAEAIAAGAKTDPRMKRLRDVGKTTMLSSQYGIGAEKFSNYLSRAGLRLSDSLAEHKRQAAEINHLYNRKHAAIAAFRRECGKVAEALCDPRTAIEGWTPARCRAVGSLDLGGTLNAPAIILPNGFPIVYPNLRQTDNELLYTQYLGGQAHAERRLYGGALFNNITQGLAFAILAWQGARLSRLGRVALNVHDEWILAAPEAEAESVKLAVLDVLRSAPPWLPPGIPLDAEAKISRTL